MLLSNPSQAKTARIFTLKNMLKKPTQEQIIFLVTIVLFGLFSIFIGRFLSLGNLLNLTRNVSILGILSVGMGIVVIGRGLDLSQVTTMAVCSAWLLKLMNQGVGMTYAILLGLALAVLIGLVNGLLIAYIEIPPLFTTLATGLLIYGVVRTYVIAGREVMYLPSKYNVFLNFAQGHIGVIPMPIILFGLVAFFAYLFLSQTSIGHFIYVHGDSLEAARLTGLGVRPLTVLEYVLCAVIGYIAGLLAVSSVAAVDLRITSSTLVFDVILIVVLGGISLIGGRGGIWSVIVGTLLIGTLLNGMTLLNLQNDFQNIIKAVVLMGAIISDNRLHPRDEETARQGDI